MRWPWTKNKAVDEPSAPDTVTSGAVISGADQMAYVPYSQYLDQQGLSITQGTIGAATGLNYGGLINNGGGTGGGAYGIANAGQTTAGNLTWAPVTNGTTNGTTWMTAPGLGGYLVTAPTTFGQYFFHPSVSIDTREEFSEEEISRAEKIMEELNYA